MPSHKSIGGLLAAVWLSCFATVSTSAPLHHTTVFGDRLCPDAVAIDSRYAEGRDFLEFQELMFALWRQDFGCLDGERWNDYLKFRELARDIFPFLADAFGHWDTPLREFGLYQGMFESGSFTLSLPTVGDLVEFEILIGWMEKERGVTPWFIPAGDESIRAFVPYAHTKSTGDPPPGYRFQYLASRSEIEDSIDEVLNGLITMHVEAPIEHFEAFKAWLNVGDLALTAEEISKAGGSKLLFIPAGSFLDNFYRGTQGEMAYGNEASVWTVYGAAYSGAQEGAQGGASIYFNTLSFGATDNLGLTESTQYQGSDYTGARVASAWTRDALILVGAGGGAPALFAGRTALAAGQTFNTVNAFIGASAISYSMSGHLNEGNYGLAATEGALTLTPWASGPIRWMTRTIKPPVRSTTPPTRTTHSPSTPATGPPKVTSGIGGGLVTPLRGNIPDATKWVKNGGTTRYHPDGGITYTTKGGVSVRYGSEGFPDFSTHLYRGTEGLSQVRINYTGNWADDFAAANRAVGFADTPHFYTWHHHQDVGLMQLVRTSVHKRFSHSGGVSVHKATGGAGYR